MTDQRDILNPSSFQLPDDFEENRDDYELWSIRAPLRFDMKALDGIALQFALGKDKKKAALDPTVTTVSIRGEQYSMTQGHKEEVASFRILKRTADGDDNDDDDDTAKTMVPLPITFQRNFNLVKSSKANIADIDLAPSNERAPEVDMKKMHMRIPYTPIAQKSGLKRRWNMMGSNSKYTSSPSITTSTTSTTKKEVVNGKSLESAIESSPKKSKKAKVKSPEKKKSKKSKKSTQ